MYQTPRSIANRYFNLYKLTLINPLLYQRVVNKFAISVRNLSSEQVSLLVLFLTSCSSIVFRLCLDDPDYASHQGTATSLSS